MTTKRSLILRLYTALPVVFFITALVCYVYSEIAWGGISWQNHPGHGPTGYELFNPWFDAILFPTMLGMLALPLLFTGQLLINSANWRRWLPAIWAYTAFLAFATLAICMGWYMD